MAPSRNETQPDDAPLLVINTGSSTFKWTLFSSAGRELESGSEEWSAADAQSRTLQIGGQLGRLPRCRAVGHRVVHGGTAFRDSVVIDASVHRELEALTALDPLHARPALCGVDAVSKALPDASQVAVFDTAFHRTLTAAAAGYALPSEWTQRWGLRRFGFHGLSVSWSVTAVRDWLGAVPARLVVAHLGSGCSVTAVHEGRSVDTTMGFTPLEGLMMATRSGSVDPGALFHLQARCGVSIADLEDALTNRSGLLGVSGVSADIRAVIAAADAGNENAALARDRFILHARRGVGAMSGVLGGADALVLTGGIAEHQPGVRRSVAEAIDGCLIDPERNECNEEGLVSKPGSTVLVLMIRAREDLVVLRELRRVLSL